MISTAGPIIKRALLSVSDKQGIADLAHALHDRGVELLSTGGTARLLSDKGIPVTEVSTYTGFPELLDGRLKTLHPKVHGGLLGRRGVDDSAMESHGILPIDLLVVNLYPFARTMARPDCDPAAAIEQIDIGGPAMLRSAAKNHAAVAVVVDPSDYSDLLAELHSHNGAVSSATRLRLAAKAFEHTARYDGTIAGYLGSLREDGGRDFFPHTWNVQMIRSMTLRYGENPHQRAALYVEADATEPSIVGATQLQGKELSYNNVADADAALECVKAFNERPACVIVKHANPCGVAFGRDLLEAYDRAYETDPTSAFGGIIAFNRALDAHAARAIMERQFVEVIVAPEISEQAQAILATKKNVRVLACGRWGGLPETAMDYKRVVGGLLVQDRDVRTVARDALKVVTRKAPASEQLEDLWFAWRVVKFVKSNAIVYARQHQTVGIGAGQMSRVMSARIAALKAAEVNLPLSGAVMASDAFFPFRDGIDEAAAAGIAAVIQPGGSLRDNEVIAAADAHGIAMVFTGMRHFRH